MNRIHAGLLRVSMYRLDERLACELACGSVKITDVLGLIWKTYVDFIKKET
jgi:hypothetical protein